MVGDSVRESLADMALRRLGNIHFALATHDRLFEASLAERLRVTGPGDPLRLHSIAPAYFHLVSARPYSPALALPGIVARQDGTARANRVNVLGVDAFTWPGLAEWGRLSPEAWRPGEKAEWLNLDRVRAILGKRGEDLLVQWNSGETAFINEALARQLAAREGDDIVLRVRKPSALGLDAAISPRNEDTVARRLKVGAILQPEMLGDFGLTAQAAPPANLFLPEQLLPDIVGVPGRANLLVTGQLTALRTLTGLDSLRFRVAKWLGMHAPVRPVRLPGAAQPIVQPSPYSLAWRLALRIEPKRELPVPDALALPWRNSALARTWLPEDAGLSVRPVEQPASATGGEYIRPCVEVSSSRIFFEPSVIRAALTPRTSVITNRQAFEGDEPAMSPSPSSLPTACVSLPIWPTSFGPATGPRPIQW